MPPTASCKAEPFFTHRRAYMLLMVLVLNHQYLRGRDREGQLPLLPLGPPSPAQALALGLLGQAADVHLERNAQALSWTEWVAELRSRRGLDYDGGEGPAPEPLALDRCLPGLPAPNVSARFRAADFATGTVRDVLLDPGLLVTGKQGEAPAQTRFHAEPGEEDKITRHLLSIGILQRVPTDAATLLAPDGRIIAAGGFGVVKLKAKQVLTPGKGWRSVLRLVWNLRPLNDFLLALDGDADQLPTPAQYAALALLPREWILLSIADRSAFFYIFQMEKQWIELQRTVLDCPDTGQSTGLATLGMGLKPAVAITLHLHRNLLRWEAASGLQHIRSSDEVERRLWEQDFSKPQDREASEAGPRQGPTPVAERPAA